MGLLVHLAEHTRRHVGEAISAAKLARALTAPVDHFLWPRRLQASADPEMSTAVLPSSMYVILPSVSTTKVARLAMPRSGIKTP